MRWNKAGAQTIFCSGQLGIRPDASIPADVEAQATLCFEAIAAILAAVGVIGCIAAFAATRKSASIFCWRECVPIK